MRTVIPILLFCPALAQAAWPEDVSLSSMVKHDGATVADPALLGASYTRLVQELGTVIANPAEAPAKTLGAFGFDLTLSNRFAFIEATQRDDEVSPWDRAQENEDASSWIFLPTISARKGLPLSLEVGGTMSWLGMSRTGSFGGFARWAPLDGYKPWPDLAFQVGYSGYVGNDELDLGVLDASVTLGTTLAIGSTVPQVNSGQFSPWFQLATLGVRASPNVSPEVERAIGASTYRRKSGDENQPPLALLRLAAGIQVATGNVHFRLSGSWVPKTIPTANVGMGFGF